ncbi:MAG: hypothetical protein FK733_10955 [Asgard group archaeon]|nr:hypothetical protein [Asgard group archaeon]
MSIKKEGIRLTEEIIFPCDVCKEDISIGENIPGTNIISKQTTSDDFFGSLTTFHIESSCKDNEIHVNIVVIDGQNRYRGHKYSSVKTSQPIHQTLGANLQLLLSFGKDLSKVVNTTLQGNSLVIAGDSPTTNLWAKTLYDLFTISNYTIRRWIISEQDFDNEYFKNPLRLSNEFILIDSSLIKKIRKSHSKLAIVDLRKNKTYGVNYTDFTKELVTTMLKVPSEQSNSILNYLNIQIEWLKRLLNELRGELDSSIVETAACPVGNLSETVIINSVLDQILTEKVIGNLRARMRNEEFEIVVSHLLRDVPELEDLVRH